MNDQADKAPITLWGAIKAWWSSDSLVRQAIKHVTENEPIDWPALERQAEEDRKLMETMHLARLRRARIRMTAIKLMTDAEQPGSRPLYKTTAESYVLKAAEIVDQVDSAMDKLIPGDDPEHNPNTLH